MQYEYCTNFTIHFLLMSDTLYLKHILGVSHGVWVNKQDKENITNEFESRWVPHTSGFVSQQRKA